MNVGFCIWTRNQICVRSESQRRRRYLLLGATRHGKVYYYISRSTVGIIKEGWRPLSRCSISRTRTKYIYDVSAQGTSVTSPSYVIPRFQVPGIHCANQWVREEIYTLTSTRSLLAQCMPFTFICVCIMPYQNYNVNLVEMLPRSWIRGSRKSGGLVYLRLVRVGTARVAPIDLLGCLFTFLIATRT